METLVPANLIDLLIRLLAIYLLLFFLGLLNALYITAPTDVPMDAAAGKIFYLILVPFLVGPLCTGLMVLESAVKILVGSKNLFGTWLSVKTKQKMRRSFLIFFSR